MWKRLTYTRGTVNDTTHLSPRSVKLPCYPGTSDAEQQQQNESCGTVCGGTKEAYFLLSLSVSVSLCVCVNGVFFFGRFSFLVGRSYIWKAGDTAFPCT